MTKADLLEKYTTAYRIIRSERAMRERVFPEGHPRRVEKLQEMDKLLEVLDWMKDELKLHLEPEYEQPALIDVPKPVTYN